MKKTILLVLLLSSFQSSAQILGFHPKVDTLFTAGGCTPTQIKSVFVPGQDGIDTLKILPDWNTWFWSSSYFGYSQAYFLISDSLKHDKMELWMQPSDAMEEPILIQADSVVWFGAYEYTFKLILIKDQISIDSLSQFCKARIGMGSKKNKVAASPEIRLSNRPNPFNQETIIHYEIGQQSTVEIKIYNLRGQHVAELVNAFHLPGAYRTRWRTGRLGSGPYLIVLTTEDAILSCKCFLFK